MPRYFLEVSYKGTNYSGFQVQEGAPTIQSEVEKAFRVLQRENVKMTGSSRTDAGVHAIQNFFHFDYDNPVHSQFVYKMNAILPSDIVVKSIKQVDENAHCRFDAIERRYRYYIYTSKNPFYSEKAYFFPYTLNIELLNTAAEILFQYTDFTSFSKRNTQVKSFQCTILESKWVQENDLLVYSVSANRFLRGMVRALTATMLRVGTQKISISDFVSIIQAKDCTVASFDTPAHGLFLTSVIYKDIIV